MLVLTRKQNEKIRIGSSIVITVVRMKGNAVRLGIEAPKDVNIIRGELAFESAEREDEKASSVKLCRERTSDWPAERRDERAKNSPLVAVDSSRSRSAEAVFFPMI